jgi:hypothetical protein
MQTWHEILQARLIPYANKSSYLFSGEAKKYRDDTSRLCKRRGMNKANKVETPSATAEKSAHTSDHFIGHIDVVQSLTTPERLRSVHSRDGEAVGSTVHLFERAGLGKAPFTFIGMEEKVFQACPGAPRQPGGCCDYCGTGIHYQFHIKSADNKFFKVGSDCVHKTDDAGLRRVIDAKVAEMKREASHKRDDARIAAARALLPQVREILAAQPAPLEWKPQNTKLDTVEWYLANAGRSGKCWAAKVIETAAKELEVA